MKKLIAILLSLSLILALFAGCGGSSNSQNDSSSPASSSAGEKVEKSDDNPDDEAADPNDMSNLRVAAVFPGPRGDSGTVDMACAAMEKLEAECGLQIEIVEGDGTNDVAKMEASLMDTADEGYDMIISTGTMSVLSILRRFSACSIPLLISPLMMQIIFTV